MTTIAYIANEFPSPVEPYVMDEIAELRRHGIKIVCCSGKRVSPADLTLAERAFWKETRFFQPLSDETLVRAARRLAADHRHDLWYFLRALAIEPGVSPGLRIRAVGHTLMGVALAEELAPHRVRHIHAHHGYFASWMALVAARLLAVDFSFTLHGSDLLRRADLLAAKLRACRFCMTVSDYNRRYILENYPSIPAEKVLVRRLGVDRVLSWPADSTSAAGGRMFCILAVGRLHPVKNYEFLIRGCAALRNEGLDFLCWIVGEGPERNSLERQIAKLGLRDRVQLIGYVPRAELGGYYQHADLVVLTSKSEGIPVSLMEAMSHGKSVLAPSITGIPELVEQDKTGFLYRPGSLLSFIQAVAWIYANQSVLSGVRQAAAAKVAAFYNRQSNLRAFADEFLARIPNSDGENAHPLLQQVRLSV